MKRFVLLLSVVGLVAGFSGWWFALTRHQIRVDLADKKARSTAESEKIYFESYIPAPGRAEFVPGYELLAEPQSYSGKRVILEGILRQGFEVSSFSPVSGSAGLRIWTEINWPLIEKPMGDFSQLRKNLDYTRYYQIHRVIAEGTFRFQEETSGFRGFGHLGGSNALFVIDRIFEFDPVEDDPDDAQTKRITSHSGGTAKTH